MIPWNTVIVVTDFDVKTDHRTKDFQMFMNDWKSTGNVPAWFLSPEFTKTQALNMSEEELDDAGLSVEDIDWSGFDSHDYSWAKEEGRACAKAAIEEIEGTSDVGSWFPESGDTDYLGSLIRKRGLDHDAVWEDAYSAFRDGYVEACKRHRSQIDGIRNGS